MRGNTKRIANQDIPHGNGKISVAFLLRSITTCGKTGTGSVVLSSRCVVACRCVSLPVVACSFLRRCADGDPPPAENANTAVADRTAQGRQCRNTSVAGLLTADGKADGKRSGGADGGLSLQMGETTARAGPKTAAVADWEAPARAGPSARRGQRRARSPQRPLHRRFPRRRRSPRGRPAWAAQVRMATNGTTLTIVQARGQRRPRCTTSNTSKITPRSGMATTGSTKRR